MKRELLVLIAGLACACGSPTAQTEPETTGPVPVRVAEVGLFAEGIVIDHDGNLYASHEDQISRVTLDGEVSPWGTTPSPNGHKVLADGTHIVCDREGAVYFFDGNGTEIHRIEVETACNDITLDGAGGFYFTSPYGSQNNPSVGAIYHVSADRELTLLDSDIHYPNGIVLRPDGGALVVGESFANRLLEYPVESPGHIGERSLFAMMPLADQFDSAEHLAGPLPDGMAYDTDGNLYVAYYGSGTVQVFAPSGKPLPSIPAGGQFPANVAFIGDEMNQLLIVGSTGPVQQSTGMLNRVELPRVTGVTILPERAD